MFRNIFLTSSMLASSACALFVAAAPAHAQNSVAGKAPQDLVSGEIVVTAQRREEKLRDVPISIVALNSEQLQTANVQTLADTAKLTPALRFDSISNFTQPTIRGVGTAVQVAGGGPNVGIYEDGFFQPNPLMADFQLLNVKNIQVLKGPQGTLFGRNTTGGAILVTTKEPSHEAAAEFQASYARFNTVDLQGYATAGLSNSIAMDVQGRYTGGDGFRTNTIDGNGKVGRFHNWSVRGGLKVDFSDTFNALIRYSHSEMKDPTHALVNAFVDSDGSSGFLDLVSPAGKAFYGRSDTKGLPLIYFYAPPGTYATKPNEVAFTDRVDFTNNSDAVQLTLSADLGFADLKSYTQVAGDDSVNYTDLDFTALPIFYLQFPVTNRTISQELIMSSKPGSRLQWTGGLSYFRNRDTWDLTGASFGGSPLFPFGGSSQTSESYAAFADLTYEVSPRFFITAGARYSRDLVIDAYFKTSPFTTSYEGPNGLPVSTAGIPPLTPINLPTLKNNKLTPRVVLRWKPSDSSSIYASYTKGYKAGLYSVGGMSAVPVRPEDINAYEIGYKFGQGGLSFDTSAYYYDYKNLQITNSQAGTAQIRNAAGIEIYGAEAQLTYRASQALTLNLAAAYTHGRYKSFPNAPFYSYCDPAAAAGTALACTPPALGGFGPGGLVQTVIDAKGLKIQRTPEFTANAGAAYKFDLGGGKLTLSGNIYYSSSFFFDAVEQLRQKAFETVSARAEWVDPSGRVSIAVFGDNLTNNRHLNQILSNTFATGAGWNSPVSYGVSVGTKF